MERMNIILEDGTQKEVDCLFYLYSSRYYFIYTLKELDENEYVVLHIAQVGKETQNTPNGPVDTGYMIGMDITDENENNIVQSSITKIVEDKKAGIDSPEIQYLPLNMLPNLKIVSKKTFRLLKSLIEQYFGLQFENSSASIESNLDTAQDSGTDVIVDYRSKFFEEQEKNQNLEDQIRNLEEKLNNIKQIIG